MSSAEYKGLPKSSKMMNIKVNGKLILGEEIIKQIHYLHHRVTANTEWSGILLYKHEAGTLEEPETLVFRATELIPMDIGTSAYTEYEFDPEDEYMFTKITGQMEAGFKLGHVHSHHSMRCFFSGTDDSELHDNAPNHNYYVSLITNYDEPDKWCAAVAFEVNQIVSGTIKKEGYKTITTKYRNISGLIDTTDRVDINETEPFDKTEKFLYKINLDIIVESELKRRVDELMVPKKTVYSSRNKVIYPGHHGAWDGFYEDENFHNGYNPNSRKNIAGSGGSGKEDNFCGEGKTLEEAIKEEEKSSKKSTKKVEKISSGKYPGTPREQDCFAPNNVIPLLIKLLGYTPGECNLSQILTKISKSSKLAIKSDEYLTKVVDNFENNFETAAIAHFNIIRNRDDFHCISISILTILNSFREIFPEFVPLLMSTLNVYVLNQSNISPAITMHLTGIEYEGK